MTPALQLDAVSVRFGGRLRLRALHLSVRRGEVVALHGESGSGKTTALRAAAGLVPVCSGRVVRHVDRIAMSFQEPRLLPWRTVLENVLFPLGAPAAPAAVSRAEELLERLGLAGVRGDPPAELSGGMRRRVALARALLVEAPLLLADEPFAHLDPHWAGEVSAMLRREADGGVAVLLSAHEVALTPLLADRVLTLEPVGTGR